MPKRVAVVGARALAGIGALGIVLAACGGPPSPADSAAAVVPASIAVPTTTSPPPTSSVGPSPTSAKATATTTTTVALTTVPPPTVAPIATYAADIGVLAPRPVAAPVQVRIPSLGVEGRVIPTGVNEADELNVPPDAKTLVWYQHGPTPGQAGSAVIAGHLDWKGVLGTFNSLADTPVGETVTVAYDDGSERAFTVRAVELIDKPAVAVNGVFARDGESVLRLVTCGGEFNDDTDHYLSNVIVTAVPA